MKSLKKVFLILLCTGALWLAFSIRRTYEPFFMSTITVTEWSRFVFNHLHYPGALFCRLFGDMSGKFLMAYGASSLFIWLGALFLYLCLQPGSLRPRLSSLDAEALLEKHEKSLLLFLFTTGFSLSAFLCFYLFQNEPSSVDEFSYLFQAKLLRAGKLYELSPPCPESFFTIHLVNNGHWFSKYPIGWPLLMALGSVTGNFHIAADLCAGLYLVVMYKLSSLLYDRKTGLLSVFFLAPSPFFLFTTAGFQSHMAALLFLTLSFFLFIRFLMHVRRLDAVLFSLSLGFSVLIRPVDVLVILPLYGLFLVVNPFGGRVSLRTLRTWALSGLPVFVLTCSLMLVVNYFQMGGALKSGYFLLKHHTWEYNGFFPALWDIFYSLYRLFMWSPCLFLEAIVLALVFPSRHRLLLAPWVIPFIIFYMGWAPGQVEYGARYYFPMLCLLPPLAGAGIMQLCAVLKKRVTSPPLFIICLICCSFLFTMSMLFSQKTLSIRQESLSRLQARSDLERQALQFCEKALIFVRSLPGDASSVVMTENFAPLTDRVIYASFFSPEVNAGVISSFRDRTSFLYSYDAGSGRMILEPFTGERQKREKELPRDLFHAANNYMGTQNYRQAAALYRKAIELDPGFTPAYLNLAHLCEEEKEYGRAIEALQLLQKNQKLDYPQIHYYIARLYAKKGEREKALETLQGINPGQLVPSERLKAEDLKRFLQSR